MKSLQIKIKGLVQGVSFRAGAKGEAEQLNIKGFARNESDGSVFIKATGEEYSLKKFLKWCKTGPEKAKVTAIEVKEIPYANYTSFETF